MLEFVHTLRVNVTNWQADRPDAFFAVDPTLVTGISGAWEDVSTDGSAVRVIEFNCTEGQMKDMWAVLQPLIDSSPFPVSYEFRKLDLDDYYRFDNPLETAHKIATDLPSRFIDVVRKGDIKATAELYNDLFFLALAIDQLHKETT